jgi:hypothetical protein
MSTGGKGSKPRPLSIPRQQFESNWDRIFNKKKKISKPKKELTERIAE